MNSTRKILTTIFVLLALLITAKAALGDLVIDESSILINGRAYVAPGPVNVSPGDTITVQFNFNNDDPAEVWAFIQSSASANQDVSPDLPYSNRCVGNDCNDGQWVLIRNSGSHQFTFTIPYEVDPAIGLFALTINVDSSDAIGIEDSALIQFSLVRNNRDFEIVDRTVIINPAELSCSNNAQLGFDIVNTGNFDINAQDLGLLIYDKAAVESSFSTRTGKFTQFTSAPVITFERNLDAVTLDPDLAILIPGDRVSVHIQIDTSALGTGSHRLYAYLVHPQFPETNNFIGDKTQVSLTKSSCAQSFSPAGNTLTMPAGSARTFSVTLRDAAALPLITWFVDNVEVAQGRELVYTPAEPGQHTVRATVSVNGGESNTWSVTASDRFFCGTGCASNRDENHLILENTFAKIEFTQPVNLNDVTSLSQVVSMTDGTLAMDSAHALGLAGRTAVVTIKKTLTNPVILRSNGFNSGTFEVCSAPTCTLISNQNGLIVFSVVGFSTYRVEEERAPALQISSILFDNANRGNTSTVNVVIKNVGSSRPLTNLQVDLVGVSSAYNAQIIGVLPPQLGPQAEATVQLQVTIPSTEDAGVHSIGNLRVSSTEDTKTSSIQINPRSFLAISKVEINGKETGDFSLEEENEITVKVKNEYTQDMENVQVTIRILNVDDDDIEEESSTFDLNNGDDEEVTFKIDLQTYELDQETYTVEIEVEGDGEDDTTHSTIQRKEVSLDLEKHNVLIQSAELGSSSLQCLPQTSLLVKIKNVGTEDEDDIEIRVKNEVMSLDLFRRGIELDKFTDTDNDFETSFSINVENVRAGSYPLTVEVYRDGDIEESKEVTLEVKPCTGLSSAPAGKATTSADALRTYLQQQLQQRTGGLGQAQATPVSQPEVRASFRETNVYLALVGVLVVLIFIATVLALAIMVVKKK